MGGLAGVLQAVTRWQPWDGPQPPLVPIAVKHRLVGVIPHSLRS
jgi:hypothetical protein